MGFLPHYLGHLIIFIVYARKDPRNLGLQILDCVTSMVYKCIDNEKLFSFFSSIFMGNRSIIGMKKKNQSFRFHS